MQIKLKELSRSLSALTPKRSRRRTVSAPAGELDQLLEIDDSILQNVDGRTSPTPTRGSGATSGGSMGHGGHARRVPSSARLAKSGGKGSLASRRSRRHITIAIAADAEGRRARRRKEGSTGAGTPGVTPGGAASAPASPACPPSVDGKPKKKRTSRPTSWVTLASGRWPSTMSPPNMSPVLDKAELYDESSSASSTIVATPTSILPVALGASASSSDAPLGAEAADAAVSGGAAAVPVPQELPCLLERICSPSRIERRPSQTRKPAPGGVYIFDVVSEEQPLPTETTTERTARLARSEQRAPLAYRVSPWKRVVSDVLYLFSHLGSIPSMFVPCRRHAPGEKCHGHLNTATLTQAGLLLASCVVTLLGIGSLLACMPTVAALLLLVLLSEFVQGPTTRESKRPDVVPVPGSEREAWFFVNGVAATGSGTQGDIDHLHGLVRRPITALMNRSLGLWFDFLQSVLQRNLFLPTRDLRQGYKYVHEAIMNSTLDRIVLVAHSQGGIIVSAWVDQLIADLHPSLLTRVEVYTFGSAASHFALRADGEGAFARIEHFANMHDLVAQFGVLHHARGGGYAPTRAREVDDGVRAVYGRYVGRVFARNRTGHLFRDHYLHPSDSILTEDNVRAASRFAAYVGGGNLLPPVAPASPPVMPALSEKVQL